MTVSKGEQMENSIIPAPDEIKNEYGKTRCLGSIVIYWWNQDGFSARQALHHQWEKIVESGHSIESIATVLEKAGYSVKIERGSNNTRPDYIRFSIPR